MLIGGSGWLVALSPPGRLSGAHINPAISIGFWILGKMHRKDLVGYVVAQMAGGVAGALLAGMLFPGLARPIHLAVLKPAAGVTPWLDFTLETVVTFTLASVIFSFVASKSLARFTPAAVTVCAGVLNCLDGKVSGAGMNPARWFGPACALTFWHLGWVYVAGPVVGALLAALIRRIPQLKLFLPHTAKMFHDPAYRSIFKHEKIATTPPDHIRESNFQTD
jgi:aquaporin Z